MSKKAVAKKNSKPSKRYRTFEGLPVVDANEDIILNVTEKDARISKAKDPSACAAANAGKREFHTDVRVFLSRMYVKQKTQIGKKKQEAWVRYLTPNNVGREIVSFDRGSSFEPGEYKFKAATPGQRLGTNRGNNHRETGNGKTRRKLHRTNNVRDDARYDSK